MLQRTTASSIELIDLYYRFLNCGFRLGVSGGSAIGVMPVPLGYNRVYARIDGRFDSDSFWEAVKAGRSFATSGPMISLEADGHPIGATVSRQLDDSDTMVIVVRVRSLDQIESIQLIHDGAIAAGLDLASSASDPQLERTINWEIKPERSGWIAARALFREVDGRLRQAHTSPIYIELDGMPIASKKDAEYMIRWVSELEKIADRKGRYPEPEHRQQILETYKSAKSVYEKVVSDAEGFWGD